MPQVQLLALRSTPFMNFPLNSLCAFVVSFGATSLLCAWLRIRILGWYEKKWSADANLVSDVVSLILLLPIVALCFAFGAYVVNSSRDPWLRSLAGGFLLAVLFFGVTRLSLDAVSPTLDVAMTWGTLLLGPAIVGAWARLGSRSST